MSLVSAYVLLAYAALTVLKSGRIRPWSRSIRRLLAWARFKGALAKRPWLSWPLSTPQVLACAFRVSCDVPYQ